ncbi:MAG: penicillin-binding transpeptidase domain-containing protein [Dehalococcoidia bacterium]|nr:penicillin-binding transpeptidase domain-containing protein [Dehalococcoidia bacterium]
MLNPEGDVVRELQPEGEQTPIDPGHLEHLRTGMEMSVNRDWGAGHNAFRPGLNIAGKTGTAEFTDAYGNIKEHAWFTGYYPAHDPEVAVTVYFDLGIGGNKAAPAAAEILEFYDEGTHREQVQTP